MMGNKTKTLIILGFWLILALFFVGINEKVFLTGDEIRLNVKPVDPRDLLRGQYVALNYDISEIQVGKNADFKRDETVYVTLIKEGEIYVAQSVYKFKPSKNPYIKGKVDFIRRTYGNNKSLDTLIIKYGIENLFTKEQEAKDIEKRLQKGGIAVIKLDKSGSAKVLKVE
ncbi:MAG: GDYXXLXY domain-containing protein [Candidatus Gastranaerophilales bacterium]|nr:GDYXXLXY domain-containing protein [Candidatus Gastranaerophilales bacterium]